MATVWAYRVGAWSTNPATGWSHTIQMKGFADLVATLSKENLGKRVSHLAIVAHGDQPGQIVLDKPLTAATLDSFDASLARLGAYLTPDGMLSFYSCIAGKGPEGSALLVALSSKLRGRTIVGFELFGLIGPPGLKNAPGNMVATEASNAQMAMNPSSQHGKLSPWCPFAKRALNGQIVHYPLLEQASRPDNSCANPQCPGHKEPSHFCKGW
jgi:hypothetical protein